MSGWRRSLCSFRIPGQRSAITSTGCCKYHCLMNSPAGLPNIPDSISAATIPASFPGQPSKSRIILHGGFSLMSIGPSSTRHFLNPLPRPTLPLWPHPAIHHNTANCDATITRASPQPQYKPVSSAIFLPGPLFRETERRPSGRAAAVCRRRPKFRVRSCALGSIAGKNRIRGLTLK